MQIKKTKQCLNVCRLQHAQNAIETSSDLALGATFLALSFGGELGALLLVAAPEQECGRGHGGGGNLIITRQQDDEKMLTTSQITKLFSISKEHFSNDDVLDARHGCVGLKI